MDEIKKLEEQFQAELNKAQEAQDFEALRIKYLGRKSLVNDLFGRLSQIPKEEKAVFGQQLNVLKQKITAALEEKSQDTSGKEEKIDLTLPPKDIEKGSLHILSQVSIQICSIFERLGFAVIEGAEIDDDWHNFTALNFPDDHPSRDAFDTFF